MMLNLRDPEMQVCALAVVGDIEEAGPSSWSLEL